MDLVLIIVFWHEVNIKNITYDAENIMLTAGQIRAARALLRWSSKKLSEQCGLSLPTIQRMENAESVPTSYAKNLNTVQKTLEAAGIQFIDEDDNAGAGVRFKQKGHI